MSGESNWSTISYLQTNRIIRSKEFSCLSEITLRNSKIFRLYGKMKTIYWKWNQIHQICSTSHISKSTLTSQVKMTHSWYILQSRTTHMEAMLREVESKAWRSWRQVFRNHSKIDSRDNKNYQFHCKINWWKSSVNQRSILWKKQLQIKLSNLHRCKFIRLPKQIFHPSCRDSP